MIFARISSSSGWKGNVAISSCHACRSSNLGRAASRGILTRQSQIGQVYFSSSLTFPRAILRHLPWYLVMLITGLKAEQACYLPFVAELALDHHASFNPSADAEDFAESRVFPAMQLRIRRTRLSRCRLGGNSWLV